MAALAPIVDACDEPSFFELSGDMRDMLATFICFVVGYAAFHPRVRSSVLRMFRGSAAPAPVQAVACSWPSEDSDAWDSWSESDESTEPPQVVAPDACDSEKHSAVTLEDSGLLEECSPGLLQELSASSPSLMPEAASDLGAKPSDEDSDRADTHIARTAARTDGSASWRCWLTAPEVFA
mmetsp:Transcript_15555/g.32941  ORF Transcript_15555/g.32941 Transcript_15555/m.32941 type:complete len:180 (-) Transcript_15555:56-595(-)